MGVWPGDASSQGSAWRGWESKASACKPKALLPEHRVVTPVAEKPLLGEGADTGPLVSLWVFCCVGVLPPLPQGWEPVALPVLWQGALEWSRKCGQSCILVFALGLLPAGLLCSPAVLRDEKLPPHGCEPHASSRHVCSPFPHCLCCCGQSARSPAGTVPLPTKDKGEGWSLAAGPSSAAGRAG